MLHKERFDIRASRKEERKHTFVGLVVFAVEGIIFLVFLATGEIPDWATAVFAVALFITAGATLWKLVMFYHHCGALWAFHRVRTLMNEQLNPQPGKGGVTVKNDPTHNVAVKPAQNPTSPTPPTETPPNTPNTGISDQGSEAETANNGISATSDTEPNTENKPISERVNEDTESPEPLKKIDLT